ADDRFQQLASDALRASGVRLENFPDDYIRAAFETCKGKINTFDELVAYCGFYFTHDIGYSPKGVAKNLTAENKPRLQAVREAFVRIENVTANEIEAAMKATAKELGVKMAAIVHQTRLAVHEIHAGSGL